MSVAIWPGHQNPTAVKQGEKLDCWAVEVYDRPSATVANIADAQGVFSEHITRPLEALIPGGTLFYLNRCMSDPKAFTECLRGSLEYRTVLFCIRNHQMHRP